MPPSLAALLAPAGTSAGTSAGPSLHVDAEGQLALELQAWMLTWDVAPAALQHLVEGAVTGAPVETTIGADARADLARIVERAGRALLAE